MEKVLADLLDEVRASAVHGQEVFTRDEACRFLRIGGDKLREEVELGHLPYSRNGARYLFLRQDLLDWVSRMRVVNDPEGDF